MLKYYNILLISYLITKCSGVDQILNSNLTSTKSFMFWPMATVPFYINPDHFDKEQAITIMSALSIFAFKTCLKFMPLLVSPEENQHVLTFINPDGIKRCKIQAQGHSNFHPHLVQLGYECLDSPQMEMIIMRALGFPFEHNRMSRDVYIDVLVENIEPTSVELFTKESFLPPALRAFPYDINSVMHFGERDYSKNGHRTIKFKNPKAHQNRVSLTETDVNKIEVVYGSECQNRDRQEKIEMCQSYPGVARKKRETLIDPPAHKSLRVNLDITPPPSIIAAVEPIALEDDVDVENEESEYLTASLKALGIVNETEHIIEQVYKVSALALKNARAKYCNKTSNTTTAFQIDNTEKKRRSNVSDILGILEVVADYAKSMVDNAVSNLTIFCENADSIDTYQRQCKWSFNNNCPKNYRSTKHGPVKASTQHRPIYQQQTRHVGGLSRHSYDRARKSADEEATTPSIVRRKRDTTNAIATPMPEEDKGKEKKIVEEVTEINHDNTTQKLTDATTGNSMPENVKKNVKQRFFQHRRHRKRNDSDMDYEDSNVSLEKEEKKRKRKEDTENDDEDADKDKDHDAEAEKLINKEQLVKEVLNEGLEKIIDAEKKDVDKTKEVNEGIKKNTDWKKRLKKQRVIESEEDETEEDESEVKETVEESDVETTTKKRKRYKAKVDKKVEKVEKTKAKKDRTKKKLRNTKHKKAYIPSTVTLNKLNREFYDERKWPDGVVRYVIKHLPEYDLEDLRNRLAQVNSILQRKTCVKLVEIEKNVAEGYDDYLVLDNSPDYVTGRVGGKQIFGCVELFQGGQHRQHTAMMVMAMLGFYFEVARHDRDQHIRVHNRHVRPDKLHHFEKIREEATFELPYDYQSATHPAWQFWRKIGKTGISTVATYKQNDPDGSVMRALGQNPQLLSNYDIIKINSVYGVDCFQKIRATDKENVKQKHTRRERTVE